MLQFTVHGLSATQRIFSTGAIDHKWYRNHGTSSGEDDLGDLGPRNDQEISDRTTYALRPIHIRFASREIKDVFLALHYMGLGLAQFHIVKPNTSSSNETQTAEESPKIIERLTSEYAIVPLIPFTIPSMISSPTLITENPWSSSPPPPEFEDLPTSTSQPPQAEEEDIYSRTNTIPNQLLLATNARTHLQTQLSLGETTITLREKRRVIILEFEFVEHHSTITSELVGEEHAASRKLTTSRAILKDFRQATLSGASHDMLHSVVGAMRNWRAIP
ncbi:hypothetical protein CBER1_06946 [Cercospora berteroae]|uniref:Uncharacterized protein n=1 Tax=Cercospora berteroae TaxID=357750 RepID=A0A2S6C3W8_9PEZI|nr:hypothetical protein CBER1_06946 [Cercospora berteroae]